jgi:superfamily I DNA and RNA helicase
MPIEFIPARIGPTRGPVMDQLIQRIREQSDALRIADGIMYYGWPKFTDYEAVRHYVDIAILSRKTGLLLFRVLPATNQRQIAEVAESISQVTATAMAQLVRSPLLRTRSRQLKVSIVPALLAPGYIGPPAPDIEFFSSEPSLIHFIRDLEPESLTSDEFEEARSILEGAKALVRPQRRVVEDPTTQKFAAAVSKLEDEIASFDQKQRHVALSALGCPELIRGLAGSGKTVILAMKAALAHLDDPKAMILVTYYTRSLRDHLSRLVTRFYRHFGDGDPDWKKIHIYHGWGRKELPGVLREATMRAGVAPITYTMAASAAAPGQDAFDYACRALSTTKRIQPFYDLILIDEGQDFPSGFLLLFGKRVPR